MLKKILLLLFILAGFALAGYYMLYTQGAFQTKEEIYGQNNSDTTPAMKCEAGKCGAAMEK